MDRKSYLVRSFFIQHDEDDCFAWDLVAAEGRISAGCAAGSLRGRTVEYGRAQLEGIVHSDLMHDVMLCSAVCYSMYRYGMTNFRSEHDSC